MLKASDYDDTNNVVDIQQVFKQIFQHLKGLNLASFWGNGMVQSHFNQMVVQMVPLEVECHY